MARIRRAVFNESLLPEAQPRWDLFSAGFGLQCLAVAALVIIPMLMPQKMSMVQRYWTMPIEAPPVVAWKPQPVQPVKPIPIKREVVKVVEPPKPVVVEIPKPKIYTPVATAPVAKPATARKNTPTPDVPIVAKAFPDQNPPVSMGSSAIPTLRKPREDVQTGGFGDPDGVAANGKTNRAANIAVKGSFDLPPGPGTGNGTGGSKGAKGVIASTGFGNGVATGSPGGSGQRSVQQGGFADEHAVAAGPKVDVYKRQVLVALVGGALLSQGFKNWTGHTVFGAPGTPIAITQNALPVSLGNFANGFSAVLKPALPAVVNISSSKVVKPGRNQQLSLIHICACIYTPANPGPD